MSRHDMSKLARVLETERKCIASIVDSRDQEALRRAKRRLLNAWADWKQRHNNGRNLPKGALVELVVSGSDYLLLRSHELVDDNGKYRDGPIKLRSG